MLSVQNGIKYLLFAAIMFSLIKAFTNENMDDTKIILLVILIISSAYFVLRTNKCPNLENYQITDTPIADSVYQEQPNVETKMDTPEKQTNIKYVDQDIRDLKDIMGIDKKLYQDLINNENKVKDIIRSKYRDEMVYTTTHPFNTVPLGTQLYGYTYLPPENWFRAYERPPVCITDKRCPVCPVASASTSGLMEFDTANNVIGPAGMNLRYIKKVLNGDQ